MPAVTLSHSVPIWYPTWLKFHFSLNNLMPVTQTQTPDIPVVLIKTVT